MFAIPIGLGRTRPEEECSICKGSGTVGKPGFWMPCDAERAVAASKAIMRAERKERAERAERAELTPPRHNPEEGAAAVVVRLRRGHVVVTREDNGAVLLESSAAAGDWDRLWSILESFGGGR